MPQIIITQKSDGYWEATKGRLVFISPYRGVPGFRQLRHVTIDDVVSFKSLEELAREIARVENDSCEK